MTLIEAIKQNNQAEFFRILNKKTPLFGKKAVDEVDEERKGSPLYWAAAYGHVHFIAPLVKAGAAVNKPDNYGATPVYVAACNGHASTIAALHNAGANVNTPDKDGSTPVFIAAQNGQASVIAALHAAGANVNTPNANGATPVYVAAQNGHASTIAALHAAGVNVNTPQKEGATPVFIAAQNGQASVIAALHGAGANMNTPLNNGETPVYIAAQKGHAEAIAALHAAGANMNTPMPDGETPVYTAAQFGQTAAITALHAAGVNVNTPQKEGATPVFIAAQQGQTSAITALLEAGADASVKTKWGTALERARQGKEPGHPEIVRLLEAHFKQYPNGIKPVLKLVPAKAIDKDKALAQKLTSPSVSPSPGYEVKTRHDSPTEPTKPAQAPLTPTLKDASNTNPFSVKYQIKYTELNFGRELGRGGFGVVHQGTWRKHTEVAIKQLLSDDISPDAKEEFETESQVMARLRSPNIVQFYGYCLSPRHCIVMEYMPNGSLFSVLRTKQPLDWSIRARIAIDMACGLAFLHQEHIVHRDIKSLNILLDKSYGAKLTDFGLSKVKTESQSQSMASKTSKDSVGTVAWMAPELFKRKAVYTQKSDIYSLGITLWELAARKIPYSADPQAAIPAFVQQGEREDIPKDCPQKLASLIAACWEGSPDKRPDADTVVTYLKSEQTDFAQFLPLFSAHQSSEYQSNLHSTTAGYQGNFNSAVSGLNNLQVSPAIPKVAIPENKNFLA